MRLLMSFRLSEWKIELHLPFQRLEASMSLVDAVFDFFVLPFCQRMLSSPNLSTRRHFAYSIVYPQHTTDRLVYKAAFMYLDFFLFKEAKISEELVISVIIK